MSKFKAVVTDLDGTVTSSNSKISSLNYLAFEKLRKAGIKIIVATGRNYDSVFEVLKKEDQLDFVVFSAGAGIIDWQQQKVIASNYILYQEIIPLIEELEKFKLDYLIHKEPPFNHYFIYKSHNFDNLDFKNRYSMHQKFIIKNPKELKKVSLVLAILHNHDEKIIDIFKEKFGQIFNIVKTTSPLNHQNIWLEIYPKSSSKIKGSLKILEMLNIPKEQVLAIGNDYNDLDFLEFFNSSFVVENAPDELKKRFRTTRKNTDNGFYHLMMKMIFKEK